MTQLWDKRWRVEIGTATGQGESAPAIDVSELDIEFAITKDLTRQPNKATVKVWNLAAEKRGELSRMASQGRVFVRVSAGYVDPGPTLLFAGFVSRLTAERGSQDVVTVLEAKDGGGAIRSSRVTRSFAPNTSIEAVVRAIADELDVGEGNLATYATGLRLENGESSFRSGFAIHGSAARSLDDILRAAGLRWTVQDGALLIRPRGQAALERVVQLAPGSGLVGSPRPEERGRVAASALLIPGLTPGALASIRSADIEGTFIIREAAYRGQTRGTAWHVDLKLDPNG